MLDDLRWFGIAWQEGFKAGGADGPYVQSERLPRYLHTWQRLCAAGVIYPSSHSRKDVDLALLAPHDGPPRNNDHIGNAAADAAVEEVRDPIFPASLRPAEMPNPLDGLTDPGGINWRFRVPDGEVIRFVDTRCGETNRVAGVDFGDFLVWRRDGYPSYELAVVEDDHVMQISEVVRGEDLLTSTARQLLIYRALGWEPPSFYHCPLVRDESGRRLAKRSGSLALSALRAAGHSPADLRAGWQ